MMGTSIAIISFRDGMPKAESYLERIV